MIVRVDVMIDEQAGPAERPPLELTALVEVRDVSAVDGSAITLARRVATVNGAASDWLTTTELVIDQAVDPRSDLTVWVRVTDSPEDDLAVGDWMTMQSVPVDPTRPEQHVVAPVRRVN